MVLNQIALTGASGMLGIHIAKKLVEKNIEVIALSRTKPKIKSKLIKFKKFDIKKKYTKEKFKSFFKNATTIIHAGCTTNYLKEKNKKFSLKMNLKKTEEIGKFSCLNNKKLIYISGAIVYSRQKRTNSENSKIKKKTDDLYTKSKIVSEKILLKLSKIGLNLIILRPSSIYGYGQNSSKTITKLVKKSISNKKISLYHSHHQVNLVHASDVADIILKIVNSKKRVKGVFNVGGALYSYKVIGKNLKELFNCQVNEKKEIKNYRKNIQKLDVTSKKSKLYFNWKSKIKLKYGMLSIKNHEIL